MPAQDLVQVLSALPKQSDPRLLVDMAHFDDAGVARLTPEIALVQTVDFFPPVVDDPWWFGRIAAANALSDVYAMGAVPFSALNIIAFPTDKLPLEVMATILQGGGDALAEAGVLLLGGHSIVDEGIKFGVAVTGTVRPGAQVVNGGARPGDVLYLTKPLGTGAITTAARKDQADEADLAAACESMGRLNRAASEAMVAVGVHAATDVTGYGLLGHAFEMANASRADVVLVAAALPLLHGARELAERRLLSGGAGRTLKHLRERFVAGDGVPEALAGLAADSETSGGLLIAVAADRAAELEDALRSRAVPVHAVGRIEAAGAEPAVRLV
ncbi:MAG TPA: selenide, water dikinase SelD [Planctomycetota bacterium]|nr:selenide, water dikinase SelD [Planctomycetota bacterium]